MAKVLSETHQRSYVSSVHYYSMKKPPDSHATFWHFQRFKCRAKDSVAWNYSPARTPQNLAMSA